MRFYCIYFLFLFPDCSHGQVGVGSSVSVLPVPQLLETLRSLVPSFISCGDNHTAILTQVCLQTSS